MRRYVFVETAAPAGRRDSRALRDATGLAALGAAVTVALIEGGVMGAVLDLPALLELGNRGAEIGVDSVSLAQWGFDADDVPRRWLTTMDWLLDRLLDDESIVVWH